MNVFRSTVFTGVLAGAITFAPCAGADDWPQFMGPNRDGISAETGLATSWPEGGPREVWQISVGEGYGSAAIRDGEVYILDREDDEKDILRCLSLADGKEVWRYEYSAPGSVGHSGSRTAPTVDDKYVYTVGMMGNLRCINRKTPGPKWGKDLQVDLKAALPNWGFSQAPLLYKNLVIVAAQTADACAIAFDKETGDIAWKAPVMGGPAYVSPQVVTLAGVEQLVIMTAEGGDPTGGTAGFSLEDGHQLWKYEGWQCKIPIPSATPLGDDKLFITGGYDAGSAIIQIVKEGDALTAKEISKIDPKVAGVQIPNPIFHKGYLYIGNNSNERELGLTCMAPDGTVKWKTSDDDNLPGFDRGPLIIADGKLIALDGKKGTLHLIDPSPEGYKELARAPVIKSREIWAPLAFSDGKLLVRGQDTMRCLDLKNP